MASAAESGLAPDPPAVEPSTRSDGPSPVGRFVELLARHPIATVVAIGLVVAAGHAIWIWQHRQLGSLDADEAGYLATTLRDARLLRSDPLALPRSIGGNGAAPLVPIVGVPLGLLAPSEVRVALLLQPLLAVAAAAGVAAVVRRLAGAGASILAGASFVVLPTVVFASQTYWFGLGATVAFVAAIWALLASERLTNRHAWTFGACLAAAVLARTMMLGFLPGVLVAAALLAGRSRRSWVGLAKAVGALVALAGPWYLVARDGIFGYLVSYGYGDTAAVYGEGGPLERAASRLERLQQGIATPAVLALASVGVALAAVSWWANGDRSRDDLRIAAALLVAWAGGFAALVTTTNAGVWFELPLVALGVALVAASLDRAPRPLALLVAAAILLGGTAQLAVSWWVVDPAVASVPLVDPGNRASQYEYAFAAVDPRFLPARRGEVEQASQEWAALSDRIVGVVEEEVGRGAVVSFAGSFPLFNANTAMLAGELEGWTPRIRVVDTSRSPGDLQADLTPTTDARAGGGGGEVERVLVVAEHDFLAFPADAGAARFEQLALDQGWVVVERAPMPTGGVVRVLRHPGTP